MESNVYLRRHAIEDRLITSNPPIDLSIVVVIPCHREPAVTDTIAALTRCQPPDGHVEILVVVNAAQGADEETTAMNLKTAAEILQLKSTMPSWITLHLLDKQNLPIKKAGVGLARKLGMDEAVRRFEHVHRDGIIATIDADCTCTADYLIALRDYFTHRKRLWSGCFDFVHRTAHLTTEQQTAIIHYELHLRYFINAQRVIGLPFAYQTVGSCMAVRSSGYQKRGGMNTRKAGEDFYFIHKFVSVNRHGNIPGALVLPDGRLSDRVPFGTGRAVSNYMSKGYQKTYALAAILQLDVVIKNLAGIHQGGWTISRLQPQVAEALESVGWSANVQQIQENTASFATFRERFFQWFDAFRFMKYLHKIRDTYPDEDVLSQAKSLVRIIAPKLVTDSWHVHRFLTWFRDHDQAVINEAPVEW